MACAQQRQPGPLDPKALAEQNKKILDATKDMTKASVEEAQERLDTARKEFVAWLKENNISRTDKRVQSAVNNITKKQAQIDKTRGTPRRYEQLKPFAGTWRAANAARLMEFVLDEYGNARYEITMLRNGEPFETVIGALIEPQEYVQGSTLLCGKNKFTLSQDGTVLTAEVQPIFSGRSYDDTIRLQRVPMEPPDKKPIKKP